MYRAAELTNHDQKADRSPKSSRPHRRRLGRLLFLTLAVLLAALLAACGRDVTIIGILEVDLSAPMEETRTGFLEALRDVGYKAGEDARFLRRNAEVREQPLEELARELLVDQEAVLLLALSAEALQAAVEADGGAPIIFAMTGNPFAVQAKASPSAWAKVTGAVAPAPDLETVELVRRLLPQTKRFGILFDPSEADSVLSGGRALGAARESGLVAVVLPAGATSGEVAIATQSLLADGVQAIYVTPSTFLEEEFSTIVDGANAAGVPVFGTSGKLTEKGAVASYEVDWEDNGRRAGSLARRVLAGEDVAHVPISTEAVYELTVNLKIAGRLGIDVPDDLLTEAEE